MQTITTEVLSQLQRDATKVVSSNIDRVTWTAEASLVVWFKTGAAYRYPGVSRELYEALVSAESVGKYLNAHIKPSFPAERLN